MTKRKKRLLLEPLLLFCSTLVFLAPLCFDTGSRAQTFSHSFTADRILTRGNETRKERVHGIENAIRVEPEGGKSIFITRLDRKVIWNLFPDKKTYVQMSNFGVMEHVNRNACLATFSIERKYVEIMNDFAVGVGELARAFGEGNKTQRESLGVEQIGAYQCEKARVQFTHEGPTFISIEWKARELDGMVVKTQGEAGDWSTEYQNVQFGPQDPALFEIPEGYRKTEGSFVCWAIKK